LGDLVAAVGSAPICYDRVIGLEQFQRALTSACRGEVVGVQLRRLRRNVMPQDVRLFRITDAGHTRS
jgi:hypothetical protein